MFTRTGKLLLSVAAVLLIAATLVWNSRSAQDWILERALVAGLSQPSPMRSFDGLKVFMCGTSSPLPAPGRAQGCVAILVGETVYIVDAGAGSAQVATPVVVPLENLEAVFLTHYHSDHIAALPEFNLNSWVAGRSEPLAVYGPEGIDRVVGGLNEAYALDSSYRVGHHGADLLPPELGVMDDRLLLPGTSVALGELTVSSFVVDHDPVRPAVGYRFDYKGRSVVVSGDAVVTPGLIEAAKGADLVLQDALSEAIVQTMEKAMAGTRMEKIFFDIQDYHAHTGSLAELVDESGLRQLVLYHMVPAPQNALMEKIFARDLPPGTILSEDTMMFELPAGSDSIRRIDP